MNTPEQKVPPAAFYLFIGILFFAPLAFATVELWSLTIVELAVAMLGLLLVWLQWKGRIAFVDIPGLLPLLLLLLWMVLQIIPLPPILLHLLSPGSYAIYQPVHEVAGGEGWIPLSINSKATLFEMLRIGSYALFYIITIQLLTSGVRLQKTVKLVAGLAVFIAFLAIIQRYTSPEHIYWFRPGPSARFMGPWIHRGQFAGFMAMLLPLLLGLFLYYRPSVNKNESLRSRIVAFFSAPGSNYQLLLASGIIVVIFSILLSLSRGGIMVTLVSLILFYFLLSRQKGSSPWYLIVIVVAGFGLFFLNFGVVELSQRVNDSFTADGEIKFDRINTWRDTFAIIKAFWLTGAGFATFIDIFPVFKTIPGSGIYDHAHNDYLELLTDGGIIGFLLAAWFVLAVIGHGWKMVRRRRDNFSILVGIGALVGICSMLIFAVTDFNMHNGADGLYFFFLCGLLVSCVNTRFRHRGGKATLLEPLPMQKKAVLVVLTFVLPVLVLIFPLRSFLAQQMYSDVEKIYISRQLPEAKLIAVAETVKKIQSYDPLEGTYAMVLGNLYTYLGDRDRAFYYHLTAAEKQPARGEFLQNLALLLPAEQIDSADRLMQLGYQRSLKKESLMLTYGEWLLWRGEREAAVSVLQEGLTANPGLFDDAIVLLSSHFERNEVAAMLPADPDIWIKYGTFLEQTGEVEESEFFRRRALDFAAGMESGKSSWYWQLYSFYAKQKRNEEAVDVLRRAVTAFPGEARFHILLGDYYAGEQIFYRAREEYEQVLVLEPGNEAVKRKLERLGKE